MHLWKFSDTKLLEELNFNPILERFYQYGISGLVRENIQNSLDHRLDQTSPVEVHIEIGQISDKEIPGFDEIKARINALSPGNRYVKETVEDMRDHLNDGVFDYISFEDKNTKGLSGSKYGNSELGKFSYSAYAYSKGVHHEDKDDYNEKMRGGSHGVGKIASNAASILYTMFFANCDEEDHQTLGGTIQLLDHELDGTRYRSTGYFTDEQGDHFVPYRNHNFSRIFEKSTRGLKIIVPFLRKQFTDKLEIIRTICDSFMLAILKSDLIVTINDTIINESTFEEILNDEEVFPNTDEIQRELFTKYYYQSYHNLYSDNIIIQDKHQSYRFKLYFTYDENIVYGRTGIYRSIGMKIEDKQIISYSSKPYNALLIPFSVEEDAFLKSLENESHTKLDHSHFKNQDHQSNAKRFINNLSRKIAEIIDEEISKHNPTEGLMDTSDIIYEIENTFKRDLKKHLVELNIGVGKNKKTLVKTNDTDEKGESTRKRRKKGKGAHPLVKIKKEFGSSGSKEYYQIPGSIVKRYITDKKEMLQISLSPNSISENKTSGNLLISLIDGMGIEFSNEYNLLEVYDFIADENTKQRLGFSKSTIRAVSFEKGQIKLLMKFKSDLNKTAKLKYYLEVWLMIFDKESRFPYPILSYFTEDYTNAIFNLKIDVQDSPFDYIFKVEYELTSEFLKDLIDKNKAKIYLLIQSKDSKFYDLKDNKVLVPKNRISLNKRTNIQLVVMANEDISFHNNNDLDHFYASEKSKIKIEKYNALAISNVEKFNGDLRKPFDLFEKRVDPTIKSDIKIEFSSEMIVIIYKRKELQFGKFRKSNSLNNHYVYMGLQKGLMKFIIDLSSNNSEVYIDEIEEPENPLNYKLFKLMKIKGINLLSFENIDEVISKISDRIIDKHYIAIEETVKYDSNIA